MSLRWKSFFISAGTLIGVTLVTVIASDAFQAIVVEHFGSGVIVSLVFLIAQELIKHIRNNVVIGRARKQGRLGSVGTARDLQLI